MDSEQQERDTDKEEQKEERKSRKDDDKKVKDDGDNNKSNSLETKCNSESDTEKRPNSGRHDMTFLAVVAGTKSIEELDI